MEKRELICIGCPMGCPLTVTLDGGAVVTVQGNTCPRGDAYARREDPRYGQPMHNPKVVFNEDVLPLGAALLTAGAMHRLER